MHDDRTRLCPICGETFKPRRPTSTTCSQLCAITMTSRRTAKQRGDKLRGSGSGYVKRGGRPEHRVVAEEMLGRSLLPGEVVHHINRIRWDNRPENLRVTTRSAPAFKTCPTCKQSFRVKPSRAAKSVYCSRECMATGYSVRLTGAANPHWRGGKIEHKCETCAHPFEVERRNAATARYCSIACKDTPKKRPPPPAGSTCRTCGAPINGHRTYCSKLCMANKPKKARPCATCGSQTEIKRKYCSPKCRPPTTKVTARCAMCLAPFQRFPSEDKKHCSRACYAAAIAIRQKGERSHLWKGGKTTEALRIRGHADYAKWRQKVFERDDFVCQACFKQGGQLTAHHVVAFAKDPRLRLKVSNGVTLCWSCHSAFHRSRGDRDIKEAALTKRVTTFLNAEPGVWFVKFHATGMTRAGVPDILLCVAGRAAAIELKVHPYFASPRQQHEIRRFNQAGGFARVCRSVDDVAALIDAMKDAA